MQKSFEQAIATLTQIEDILKLSYLDEEFSYLLKTLALDKTTCLNNIFQEKSNFNRNLNVTLIGGVKSAKSSFINAFVFKGEQILPTDIEINTSTLIMIEHDLQTKLIVNLYNNSNKYKAIDNAPINSIQYTIKDNNDLKQKLHKYIINQELNIASILIKINNEDLKNIRLIDTSSINSMQKDYENITLNFLPFCDVVFFLSKSSQFLDKAELKFLELLSLKSYSCNCNLIATQIDMSLFDKNKDYNDFNTCIDNIQANLSNRLHKVCALNLRLHPNTQKLYAKLCNSEILLSSNFCANILNNHIGSQELFTIRRLCKHYSNAFKLQFDELNHDLICDETSKLNLSRLANFKQIQNILDDLSLNKDKIIKQQLDCFIEQNTLVIGQYLQILKYDLNQKITSYNERIILLKKQFKHIKKLKRQIKEQANDIYEDSIIELIIELKTSLKIKIIKFLKEITYIQANSLTSSSKIVSENIDRGHGFLFWKDIFAVRYEKIVKTLDFNILNVSNIKPILENALYEIKDILEQSYDYEAKKWKNKIKQSLQNALLDQIDHKYLDDEIILCAVRKVVANIKLPQCNFDIKLPQHLQQLGTLSAKDADDYLRNINDFINTLKEQIRANIDNIATSLKEALLSQDIGSMLITKCKKKQFKLNRTLDNLNNSITIYQNTLNKLNQIKDA